MKAAAVDRFGPPSVLTLHEVPVPCPGPTEVLIAIDTAGIGSWDTSIRDGSWRKPGRTRFPLVPGVDGAGTVVARGARVRRVRVGDRVYAYEFGNRQGGFYAEFAVAAAEHVSRVPKAVTWRDAGAVATTGLTALQGIDELELRPGQTVLIFGASGAVGTIAVQLAVQRGAHVIATASGAAATRLARRLGAHHVVDARDPESIDQFRKFAPDGLDGVLALAGGDELERCLDFVRERGRVAHPNGIEPVPKARRTFRLRAYDAVANRREFDKLNRHLGSGRIRVPIAGRYRLGKAAQAHRRLGREQVLGRMILQIDRGRRALRELPEGERVTTTKQRAAARRNVKRAAQAASRKRTVAHLSKRTRTALGKEGAKAARRKQQAGRR
jgi:NADPH:quinone reductase